MFTYKSVLVAWDSFFFRPRPTEGMAIFRILWCLILFVYLLADIPNVYDFYGPHAILSMETVRSKFNYPHMNLFNMFGLTYGVVYGVMFIYGVALLFSILGFHARPSLLVILGCMVTLHQRNIWLLGSSEVLIRLVTLFLVCSPCGHTLSVDSLLSRKNEKHRMPREWSPWAWRLIQIQLSVVYVVTVWQKIKGDTWFDGSALYYATRLDTIKNMPVPFLLDSVFFLKLGTWMSLLLEVALGTLIWFNEFRRPLIIMGIIFHVVIEYMMTTPFSGIIMMALLLTFYTPEEYLAFVTRIMESLTKVLNESKLKEFIKKIILNAYDG